MDDKRTYLNSEGKWIEVFIHPQCPEFLFPGLYRCQGKAGHLGEHWCYDEVGNYLRIREGGLLEMVSPNLEEYIHPSLHTGDWFRLFKTEKEITDPEEIAQLNEVHKFLEDRLK